MATNKDKNKTIHVVSYTHWDREFRFDFETTRAWLVRLMDNLRDIMQENSDFQHFMLDGQFVLIDDYLEVRPEAREELQELAREGRIEVGPWYTLPDSSSIHGESLVRNLQTGLKKAREFGGAMELGYNVFSFGQIAQLPQIYSQFGLDFVLFYKNMDPDRAEHDEFVWEAPDGSRCFASRLGDEARWNFFFAGHIPIVYDRDPWEKDWQFDWNALGNSFHHCDPERYADFHFITDPETTYHPENIEEGFRRTIDTLQNTAVPEHLLFFDGTDFTEPHPLIPDIIREANERLGPEYEVKHSSLSNYAEQASKMLADRDLDVVKGEMKDGPVGDVHTDVCSIHPELKQENGWAENTLYRVAEPFASAAWLNGKEYPHVQIARSLKNLFGAQAHDSLHGVGPQEMVDNIKDRLTQARVIARNVGDFSIYSLASNIHTADVDDCDLFLTVFNPTAFERSEVMEAYVDIPEDIPVQRLFLEDESGNYVKTEVINSEQARAGTYHPRNRNMPYYVNRFRILFHAEDLPATGYKTFRVKWTEKDLYPYPHEDWDPLRIHHSQLSTGPQSAENEHLHLEIADNGTLNVKHKDSGEVYRGLHYFMDSGESGNLYMHKPPEQDEMVTSLNNSARISRTVDGPLKVSFEIEITMDLPHYYDPQGNVRSESRREVPVTSTISLRRGSPVIEVETEVENRVKDHFLRVCFPTEINTEWTEAGAVFNVERYPTARSRNGEFEGQELKRHQQHGFMDMSDGERGFAVLNPTVRDYEILDADRGTIAHSLVRGVNLRIPVDNRLWKEYPGDESAQSLGHHVFRYGLMPHSGDWSEAGVDKEAEKFRTPIRLGQIGNQEGGLPLSKGFFKVESQNLQFSALKKAEGRDSLLARIYNPTKSNEEGVLQFGAEIREAYLVNLDEERQEQIEVSDTSQVQVDVPSGRIITVEVVPTRD